MIMDWRTNELAHFFPFCFSLSLSLDARISKADPRPFALDN